MTTSHAIRGRRPTTLALTVAAVLASAPALAGPAPADSPRAFDLQAQGCTG